MVFILGKILTSNLRLFKELAKGHRVLQTQETQSVSGVCTPINSMFKEE